MIVGAEYVNPYKQIELPNDVLAPTAHKKRSEQTPIDDYSKVDLPLAQGGLQILPLEALGSVYRTSRGASVLSQAAPDELLLAIIQERGSGRRIRQDKGYDEANENGHNAFQDEDPLPASEVADTVHVLNAES